MERQHLVAVLAGCMSPDQATRQAAESALQQARGSPGQLHGLLHVCLDAGVDAGVRQVAAIAFKNGVRDGWEARAPGAVPSMGEPEKAAIRGSMLAALVSAPPLIKKQLREGTKSIIYADYPERWPELLPQALASITSQDMAQVGGGLSALRLVARKYEFRDEEERQPLLDIVQAAFPTLLQIFQALLASDSGSLELAELLKLVCKIFWSCTYLEVPPAMTQPEVVRAWLTCVQNLIVRPLPLDQMPTDPDARETWPWWKTKKWALHIAYRMFSRYGTPDLCSEEADVAFAALFRKDWALPLLDACLHELAGLSQGRYVASRPCNLILQYLTQALAYSHTWKHLKGNLPPLMNSVIFPMLCFSDEDAELWENDPHEYIRKGYDIIEDLHSTKTAAMNFVLELCKARPKGNLDGLVAHMVGVLGEYRSVGDAAAPETLARTADGACLAIGVLCEVLKQKSRYATSLEPMLLQHVVPLFGSRRGHLRAKACWLAGCFADIAFQDGTGSGPTFDALLQACIAALSDADLPVRMDAAVAVRGFLDAVEAEDLPRYREAVPGLLTAFLRLSQEIDNEDLTFSLETVVERFRGDMAPYAVGLTAHLTDQFWRIVGGNEAAAAAGGDEEDDDDEGALAAYGVLRTLSTILDSVSDLPELYEQLEGLVFPILDRYTSTDGQDVFEEVMQLATYITFYSPAISPRMWTLFPRILAAVREWAADYFEDALMPLDNFVSRSPDVFLHPAGAAAALPGGGAAPAPVPGAIQPPLLAAVNATVEAALGGEGFPEDQAACAPALMGVVMQACRGRVDACVAPYLTLLLRRLERAEAGEELHAALLVAAADVLYYDATQAVAFLASRPGAAQLLFGTLASTVAIVDGKGRPRAFPSKRAKKQLVLGLVATLALPDRDCPPELAAGAGQLTSTIVGLLLAIKAQEEGGAAAGAGAAAEGVDQADDIDGDAESAGDDDSDDDDDRLRRRMAWRGSDDEDDSDYDEWWSDDEEAEVRSPIDDIDPFVFFGEAVGTLQAISPERVATIFAGMDAGTQQAVQGMVNYAATVKAEAAAAAAALPASG